MELYCTEQGPQVPFCDFCERKLDKACVSRLVVLIFNMASKGAHMQIA